MISAVVLLAISLTCVFLSPITRCFSSLRPVFSARMSSAAITKLDVYYGAWVMYTYVGAQALLAIFHAGVIAYIACMAGGIYLALLDG